MEKMRGETNTANERGPFKAGDSFKKTASICNDDNKLKEMAQGKMNTTQDECGLLAETAANLQ